MARAGKTRRLWLHIKAYAPGVPKREMINTLIESIESGNYKYPKSWKVGIGWRNRENAKMRWGEFTKEMRASRASSPGFDEAVLDYLERL